MEDLRIAFEPFVDERVGQFITDGVYNFNIAAFDLPTYYHANFILRSQRDEVLGGLLGQIWGGWLQVKILWVAEPVRGRGHGGRLMDTAERYAVERDCIGATLETHNPAALAFYERCGYGVFGKLPDYPPGQTKYFLQKALRSA
jgi:ribosomal protein S18 acetylase RimI-like enzyme